jgi:Holliday junction resolvase RusA-like endonuclease
VIEFRVDGLPVPQGSMKVIHGRVIHSQGSALAQWRASIALAARKAGARPTREPITMTLTFIMPRPKTVKRNHPSVAPDLDKLIRGALDALTAIAYVDDGQVVEIYSKKIYGEVIGAKIQVAELREV